ncbi:hypothetical protein FRP1_16700 [Pseudonocardia sp. EC080625-04]|uniref:SDR family NAD(P)-dependent oxidoreductase n=1 Tax=Pseudonocardia sp. EC080625-04 TaxID=1096868 RepID=UPI0006CB58BA|nr:SDR family NAD(P)-dependent oxidoreductase [Pseudonocardia sp. EC080625-04]ALE76401.1 hypothetical protein FRP1_16700 [Pseudonocardia sp. EC080625-04]
MFDLTGAIALITGAARGIGLASAEGLAKQGCRVVLADVDSTVVKQAAHEIGDRAEAVELDVQDTEALTALVTDVMTRPHDLGILVNNAAVLNTDPLERISAEDWAHVMDVNLTAAFEATRAAAEALGGRPGRIVNVASVAGKQGGGVFGTSAYATSKGGLIALTKSSARELAKRGTTVNAVAPGPVDTDFIAQQDPRRRRDLVDLIPLGRFARAADVGAAVCFLASKEAGYVTGTVLDVNGGMVMA